VESSEDGCLCPESLVLTCSALGWCHHSSKYQAVSVAPGELGHSSEVWHSGQVCLVVFKCWMLGFLRKLKCQNFT